VLDELEKIRDRPQKTGLMGRFREAEEEGVVTSIVRGGSLSLRRAARLRYFTSTSGDSRGVPGGEASGKEGTRASRRRRNQQQVWGKASRRSWARLFWWGGARLSYE